MQDTDTVSPEQMAEMRAAFADAPDSKAGRPSRLEDGCRFVPYADWVVVRVDKPAKEWKHGELTLHRTDHIAEWTATGTVLAVGPGARDPETGVRVPLEVRAGDRVVFDWRPSHEEAAMDRLCGPRSLLLRESEIAGFVEDEDREHCEVGGES